MQFSVLMSLYAKEQPAYLRQSLDSIFSQTLLPDEVILVEDGPLTPELYSILQEYAVRHSSLKTIRLPENVGLGQALNIGLKSCTHELVARMDTDDICVPDRFRIQTEFMQNHPEVDICSGWLKEFEHDIENIRSIKKVPETHEQISHYIKLRSPLNHPAVMFKKSAVEKADGYLHFPLFEDYYLWARMFQNGARFANIPDYLLYFRTSNEMFKRRGGLKYAIDSAKFQWKMHRLGITSAFGAIVAMFVRGVVYVIPNRLRTFVYLTMLRSKPNEKNNK